MSQPSYSFQYDEFGNTAALLVGTRRVGVMSNSYTNKGTAFSEEERHDFELEGMLPPTVRTLDKQVRIFVIDRMGLITSGHAAPYQNNFARNPNDFRWYKNEQDGKLLNVVKHGKITVLIGTSGQAGH